MSNPVNYWWNSFREELRLTGTHIGCDTSYCGRLYPAVGRRRRQVLHLIRGSGRRRGDYHRRGPWKKTAEYTHCSRHSPNSTDCSAVIVRRACLCRRWRCWRRSQTRKLRTSARRWRATSAAAPATRTSSNPFRRQPECYGGINHGNEILRQIQYRPFQAGCLLTAVGPKTVCTIAAPVSTAWK